MSYTTIGVVTGANKGIGLAIGKLSSLPSENRGSRHTHRPGFE